MTDTQIIEEIIEKQQIITATIGIQGPAGYITEDIEAVKAAAALAKQELLDILVNNTPIKASTYLEFPNIGSDKCLYVDTSANKIYRWDEVGLKYYCVGSDYHNINIITGGNANE